MSARESLLRAALRLTPALTLKNPWAHLIAHHGKDVENRTWMAPESLTTLLIHAGKGWDYAGWNGRVLAEFGLTLGDMDAVRRSAIVAVADLAHVCAADRYAGRLRDVTCGCGKWAAPGQFHWVLTNVRTLPEPVPCGGRQGLWRPAPEVADAIADQLVSSAVGGKPKAPSKDYSDLGGVEDGESR